MKHALPAVIASAQPVCAVQADAGDEALLANVMAGCCNNPVKHADTPNTTEAAGPQLLRIRKSPGG
ncbi:hypothetical protein [Rhizobium mongolense]|uniref:hypothetical protein n=1 Tax=Rhizobium mongolense TaxID=57676 RepID=UPI0034A37EF3